jgi:cytochrome c556
MISKLLLFAAFAGVAFATLALAHEKGATGVVKERQDLMDQQKDDMKVIGEMIKGTKPFDAAKAEAAAHDITLTAKKIQDLFPKGGSMDKSNALPAIWEKWDRFTANTDDLGKAAATLETALGNSANQDWKAAFQKVGDVCKSCHQDFRKKEQGEH